MAKASRLSLHAAAWFFVDPSGDGQGIARNNVPIKTPFRIGRSEDNDLTLASQSVSGHHAEIIQEDGQILLRDLNSTNGTFVNGDRVIDCVQLIDGDTVQFASVVFQVNNSNAIKQSSIGGEIRTPDDAHEDAVQALQKMQLERLFSGGVVPFFQPIVNIRERGNTIEGFEVLGRSRLFGLKTPEQMFAAASRLEMEAELSRVLRLQGITLAQEGLPECHSLFVNTHPAELRCPGLVESLEEVRSLCPSRPITIEVSESVLDDLPRIVELRHALNDLDIKMAFDNFGAGQSQLFALSEVTPDVLKFDLKLVQGIHKATAKRQRFVAAMVKMICELGITPLAECVEDQQDHETLTQLGFEFGQGFLYGKPSSLPDCLNWMGISRNQAAMNKAPHPGLNASKNGSNDSSKNEPREAVRVPRVKSFLKSEPVLSGKLECRAQNAEWLLTQPSNHYTIQVLSAISRERAEEYVNRQNNPDEFAIFSKPGKTRMLYIVVYGVFADRATAEASSQECTTSAVSPWIRMLSGVHTEIQGSIV